jgi:hypothetical protein
MEEFDTLKQYIHSNRYDEALHLIDEPGEMSLEDKINKISSYSIILLMHLIKKHIEKRTTKSLEASIAESVFRIKKVNKRRKTKGYNISDSEMKQIFEEIFPVALMKASLEIFEGDLSVDELEQQTDKNIVIDNAVKLVVEK